MISSNSQDAIEILTADRNEWKRRCLAAETQCATVTADLQRVTAERDEARLSLESARAKVALYEKATAIEFSTDAGRVNRAARFVDDRWAVLPIGRHGLTRDEAIALAASLALAAEGKP